MSGGGARGWGLGEADGEGTGRGGGDLGEGGFGNGPGALEEPGQTLVQGVREQSGQALPKGLLNAPRALCPQQRPGQRCHLAQGKAHQCPGIWPEQRQLPPAGLVSPHEDPGLLQEQLQGCPAQVVTSEPHLRRKPQFKASSDP